MHDVKGCCCCENDAIAFIDICLLSTQLITGIPTIQIERFVRYFPVIGVTRVLLIQTQVKPIKVTGQHRR